MSTVAMLPGLRPVTLNPTRPYGNVDPSAGAAVAFAV